MNFKISFVSKTDHAIKFENEKIGLDGVDMIRKELAIEVPIDLIDESINQISTDIHFVISEQAARSSGKFKDSANFKVSVPDRFFNQFTSIEAYTERKEGDDRILKAGLRRVWRETEIWQAWAEAGYPDEWGFDGDDSSLSEN